jgi:hypothetical protein
MWTTFARSANAVSSLEGFDTVVVNADLVADPKRLELAGLDAPFHGPRMDLPVARKIL